MIREPLMIPLRQARPPLILALDVGTSGSRVWVFDSRARPIRGCTASARSTLRVSIDGEASFEPAQLCRALFALIDAALHAAGRRADEIAAVAVCTYWHSLLGVDESGRPTTHVLTWADTRGRGAAAALRAELDTEAVLARTGSTLHASYWPAKLRYLRESEPARYARSARWLSFAEYLQLRLFGQTWSAHGMASASGLYDQRARTWDAPLVAHLALRAGSLPEISDRPLLGLRPAFARRWPVLAGLPWFPAIGDGAGSNVGCGAVGRDTAALFLGTSGAIRVAYEEDDPPLIRGGWTYRLDERHLVVGAALSNGGNVLDWLARTFPAVDPATLWRRRAAHGLTALPLFAGDRSPSWDDGSRAAIAGLSLVTTRADIVRAMIEGVAYRVARLWRALDAGLPGVRTVIGTGGALIGRPWLMQLFADAIGRPLVASASGEGSARGAAIVALTRLGALASLADAPSPRGRVYRPFPDAHEMFAAGVDRQRRLEEAVAAARRSRSPSVAERRDKGG